MIRNTILISFIISNCYLKAKCSDLDSLALVSADSILQAVVAEEHIPGAVVLIAQHGKTIYQKAYGSAQRYDYGLQRMDALLPMTTEH
ncbi:MAG: hypothetical protein QF795_06585, partial [Candidatus Marinimicrobia bacterium]|nr:hypothetical protein [Candidatus Neomarinimicrobiota bacterium]